MKKKLTVTIGIPAYNEEQNISHLLVRLLKQKTKRVVLQSLIVVSDGSTDSTAQTVRSFKDKRIRLIQKNKRAGKAGVNNNIVQLTDTDILVMLDADVLPENDLFLEAICKPLVEDKHVGLVGGKIHPMHPCSFFERIIAYSHIFKRILFKHINSGDTIYLCHGRARAFSKALYEKIHWPSACPEDAYSYLSCKQHGFAFVYQSKACVLFRAPATLFDHAKQSLRFVAGKKVLATHFPSEAVYASYRIPKWSFFSTGIQFFLRAPATCIVYCLIQLYTRFVFQRIFYSETYDTAQSTKRLVSWRKGF